MEKNKKTIGGSIESAIQGNYVIDISSIMNEAWQKSKSARLSIIGGLSIVLFVGIITVLALTESLGGIEDIQTNAKKGVIIHIVVTLVIWPFLAALEMMGIYRAVNKPIKASMTFSFLNRGSWVALTALFISSLVTLGMSLFVVLGAVLAIILTPAVQLVVEKSLSPFQAITLCFKALVKKQFIQIALVYFSLFFLLVLALLPLALFQESVSLVAMILSLIALSYLIPFFYCVKGILYREIFGVDVESNGTDDTQNTSSEDSFEA